MHHYIGWSWDKYKQSMDTHIYNQFFYKCCYNGSLDHFNENIIFPISYIFSSEGWVIKFI